MKWILWLLLGFLAIPLQAQIAPSLPFVVNVDATLYGEPLVGLTAYDVFLPAGTYQITPVSPDSDPEAQFWAWNPWSPPTKAWESGLFIRIASSESLTVLGAENNLETPQLAFADPANVPVQLTLATADVLQIYVPDQILGDNQGGISVRIDAVPKLTIWLANTNTAIVAWPAPSTGFALYQTADVNRASWAATTNQVSVVGTNNEVFVSPLIASQFFRLQK